MLDKDYRKEQQLRSKEELDFSEHPKPWHVLWKEAIRTRQNPHTKNAFLVYNGFKVSELGWTDILYTSSIEDGIFIQTCQVRDIAYIWARTPWGRMAPWTTNDLTMCGIDYYHPRYGWYFKKDTDSLGCIYFTSQDGAFRYTKDNLMRPDSRFYRYTHVARAVLIQQWLGTPDTKYKPIYRQTSFLV